MPTQITLNQLLILGVIVGVVFGLIPLFLGLKNGNRKMGIIGFVVTVISGTLFSLLGALPAAGLFSWLALRKTTTETTVPHTDDELPN